MAKGESGDRPGEKGTGTMTEVSRLLEKFSRKLPLDAAEQEQFLEALVHPQTFHPCILWCCDRPESNPFEVEPPLDWQPVFVDRLSQDVQPGRHPLHEQGAFYCLDFSSVFAASVLQSLPQNPALVVDVCASPGGKSVFAWRSLSPQQLLCNEVIGKRMGALLSNLKRCHIQGAIALSVDSQVLAEEIAHTAEVVLVDAPCTGQSLLAKGGKAPGCFHPVTINKNANRQKRILANAAQVVSPGGYLVYMTCAYSPEENEMVSAWLLERFPQFQAVEVPHLAGYRSRLVPFPCYRMWPHTGLGAGAFTILMQHIGSGERQELATSFLERPGLKRIGV
jgi:16S rRNA C967 or C1407 C5-methylase (RsmB/RsmF family)